MKDTNKGKKQYIMRSWEYTANELTETQILSVTNMFTNSLAIRDFLLQPKLLFSTYQVVAQEELADLTFCDMGSQDGSLVN